MNHDIHGLITDKRLGSIPNTVILAVGSPRVLYHIILVPLLILGDTVDLHTMVVCRLVIIVSQLTLCLGTPFLSCLLYTSDAADE